MVFKVESLFGMYVWIEGENQFQMSVSSSNKRTFIKYSLGLFYIMHENNDTSTPQMPVKPQSHLST